MSFTRWQVVGRAGQYIALGTLHTIWGYWPIEDVVELHAAVDDGCIEENPQRFDDLLREARERFGEANVRVAQMGFPWDAITDMFEPAVIDAEVTPSDSLREGSERDMG